MTKSWLRMSAAAETSLTFDIQTKSQLIQGKMSIFILKKTNALGKEK
jgi:hypothetical protein